MQLCPCWIKLKKLYIPCHCHVLWLTGQADIFLSKLCDAAFCCELSPSEGRQQEEHRGRRRGEENLYKITAFSPAGTSLASPQCGSVAAGAAELGIIRSASWFITLETYLNNCLAASATPAPLLHCTVGDEGVIVRNTDFIYMSIFYKVFDLPAPVPLLSKHCTPSGLDFWSNSTPLWM